MVNYSEAIKRPFQDLKKLAIGIVLSIIPIVNFVALGYILENSKSAMKKNYKLTEWGHWWDLFVRGLLFLVIGLVYLIPALVVLIITAGSIILSAIRGGAMPFMSLGSIAGLGLGMIVFFLLALILGYFIPSAVLNYVSKNKFSAAFDFAEVKKRAFTGEYFAAWLVGGIYSFVIVAVLSFIPLIGGAIGSFIASLTFYTMIAEAWASKK